MVRGKPHSVQTPALRPLTRVRGQMFRDRIGRLTVSVRALTSYTRVYRYGVYYTYPSYQPIIHLAGWYTRVYQVRRWYTRVYQLELAGIPDGLDGLFECWTSVLLGNPRRRPPGPLLLRVF